MGIQLEHADTHGGVDYIPRDGTVTLEVAAVTDGERKSARDALRGSEAKGFPTATLQGCWIVFAAEPPPRVKTFVQRVQPTIAEVELAGKTHFDQHSAVVHVIQQGGFSHIYRPLLDARVERAVHAPHPDRREDPHLVRSVWVSTGTGGSVSGSYESLDRSMEAVNKKTDNRGCCTDWRHLTWLARVGGLERQHRAEARISWGA